MALDFTIIIPSYNRPDRLRTCLASLDGLDWPRDRFEVVVVDDGSDTRLDSVVEPWRESLQLVCLRRDNGGPGAARNTGMEVAGGKYIALTDDDCKPAPDWLARLFEILEQNPGAAVGGRTVNALPDNPYSTTSQVIVDVVYDYYNGPGVANFFATNNFALPAPDLRELGGFDRQFRTSEDRDLCDRWVASGRNLVYAADAVVDHAHALDFSGFFRQHFNYGRGARKFQLACRGRHPEQSTLEGNFYLELLQRLPRAVRGRQNRAYLWILLLTWQLANTAGFLAEVLFPGSGETDS